MSKNLLIFQGSKAMGANFIFHWPSASFSMHSTSHLEGVISSTHPELKEEEIQAKLLSTSSSQYAASNVWTDGIILPQHTRSVSIAYWIGVCYNVFY